MVSVIIPTYNRANVIGKTLRSILNQTYSNLEVIVVSDGSNNDTRKVVNGFDDRRLKYYEIQHSGRPAVPRNFGINKVHGKYIAFCDDDDLWFPEKLSCQINKINEDKEIGLVYTKCLLKGAGKDKVVPQCGRQGFIFKELFLSSCFIATSTVLIRREVIEAVGIFDEDVRLKAVEDHDFWLRIAMRYKIGFVRKPLAMHVENSDSITKGKLIKLKRLPLVPCKFYHHSHVGLGLFIRKMVRMLCRSVPGILCSR